MTSDVFVDAGAWIAISDGDDQYHRQAVSAYGSLTRARRPLVTTNLAIAEAYNIIRRSLGQVHGVRFLSLIRQSPRIAKIYSDATIEDAAERILIQYADQDFSFVDAVSFAVMRQRGITDAFAFDHHFRVAAFVTLPGVSGQDG